MLDAGFALRVTRREVNSSRLKAESSKDGDMGHSVLSIKMAMSPNAAKTRNWQGRGLDELSANTMS